jgi:hypothetical protein
LRQKVQIEESLPLVHNGADVENPFSTVSVSWCGMLVSWRTYSITSLARVFPPHCPSLTEQPCPYRAFLAFE